MGFSGELMFGRSEGFLAEAPVFADVRKEGPGRVSAWPARSGGWQTLQFRFGILKDPEAALDALVDWTEAPACWVSVDDSDAALVTGASPGGSRWEACLNIEAAAGLWAPVPDEVEDTSVWVASPAFAEAVSARRAELEAEVPAAARSALAWAAAAGFGAGGTADSVEHVLRSGGVFVEERFSELLDALGFPEPA